MRSAIDTYQDFFTLHPVTTSCSIISEEVSFAHADGLTSVMAAYLKRFYPIATIRAGFKKPNPD